MMVSLLGCETKSPIETQGTSFPVETTEINETIPFPTEIVETEPVTPTINDTEPIIEETEPIIPTAPNGDIITEVLHLKIKQLNVRKYAGTNSQILGLYTKGDEIIVIGRSPNGWLKVYFTDENGLSQVGYCANGYYFEEPRPDSYINTGDSDIDVSEPTVPDDPALQNQGSYGRLYIPDLKISCQLNLVDSTSEASFLAQKYTDMEDSAAFFKYKRMFIIADHKHQSFAHLEEVLLNNTIGYIGTGSTVSKFYCYKACYGRNERGSLITENGELATEFDGYIMYTYSEKKPGCDIFITFWREKTW
jgi:hypothetical protein